jgi:hypothetical protein
MIESCNSSTFNISQEIFQHLDTSDDAYFNSDLFSDKKSCSCEDSEEEANLDDDFFDDEFQLYRVNHKYHRYSNGRVEEYVDTNES